MFRWLSWCLIISKGKDVTFLRKSYNILILKEFTICFFLKFSYRLIIAKYSVRKHSTFTHVQSSLIIIKYVEVRNTTFVWRVGLDIDEWWMLSEGTFDHSLKSCRSCLFYFVLCLKDLYTLNINMSYIRSSKMLKYCHVLCYNYFPY